MRNKKGFTLIELLAVIIILGIILAIAVPRVLSVISSQKQSGLQNSAVAVYKSLENTVSMYALGLGSDLGTGTVGTTQCPTSVWSATQNTNDATCTYGYAPATGISSLEVRMVAVSGGKFAGATTVDYTGN